MSKSASIVDSNGDELGKFLRTRRECLMPADVGIASTRLRRTPGLRREEVAFLADIGVKWYTRLEMGEHVHPSPKTLYGIAQALRLSKVDTDYMFELAGMSKPLEHVHHSFEVPEAISRFVVSMRGVLARVCDQFLTPLRWNGLADGVWGYSSLPSPLERNSIVRAFSADGFAEYYSGDEYESVMHNAVSFFRRHFVTDDPSPFAQQIYEKVRSSPRFMALWDSRTVREHIHDDGPILRHHPAVGALSIVPLDLVPPRRTDLVLKLGFAGDEETQAKFGRLEAMGIPWPANDE